MDDFKTSHMERINNDTVTKSVVYAKMKGMP